MGRHFVDTVKSQVTASVRMAPLSKEGTIGYSCNLHGTAPTTSYSIDVYNVV